MIRSAALLAAMLAAGPALSQEAAMPPDGEVTQILSDRIGRDQANVGIATAIIEAGETRFVSHGTIGIEDTTPVDENTIFEAGSITKLFTSLILAELVNEGKIDLDAPVTDYLADGVQLPQSDGKAITTFDLATHTASLSGLPPAILENGADNPYSGYGREELLAWLAAYELPRPIGESFEYSNPGIALLGLVLEDVTGMAYADLVQTRILTPLEMTSSSIALTGQTAPAMAEGYNAAREPVANWDFDAFAPAGGLLTTSTDLAKFVAAASGAVETPLTPAFETMLSRTRPVGEGLSIALGWFITDNGQGEIVWHNGMTGGFSSFAGFERVSGNGVVVLSNMASQYGIDDIGMHLLSPALPLREQPQVRTEVDIDPAILPSYVGDYVLAPDVVLSVTTENDRIFAQLTGQDRFEIFPESQTAFFYKIIDAQITFDPEAGSLVLHQNGVDQPGLRAE